MEKGKIKGQSSGSKNASAKAEAESQLRLAQAYFSRLVHANRSVVDELLQEGRDEVLQEQVDRRTR